MKITFFGTTMLLFDDGKDQVLFDCHVTRPSLRKLLFREIETNKKFADKIIKDYKFDRVRGIFISHTHYDHVMDAPYFANKTGADVYGSASAKFVFEGGYVDLSKFHSYDDLNEFQIGDFSIKVIKSIHSIPRPYNDDIGQVIDHPVVQPCFKTEYKEGGSYDFIVTHKTKTYIIRPSYNFIEHQLDGLKADVMFLGCAGLDRDSKDRVKKFFKETIEKTKPNYVIPLHWDSFFEALKENVRPISGMFDHEEASMKAIERYCAKHKISYILQKPLTTIEFE